MPTEDEPFEKTMAAIGSNSQAQQGNGQVVLVLERKLPSSAIESRGEHMSMR